MVSFTTSPPNYSIMREQLLTNILSETVSFAEQNSIFYKHLYKSLDVNFSELSGFGKLPIITKGDLIENGSEMLTNDEFPGYIRITSGTTGNEDGDYLIKYHSLKEKNAWRELRLIRNDNGIIPISLKLITPDHGVDPSAGVKGVFHLPLEAENHIHVINSFLSKRFGFNGYTSNIEVLSGSTNLIRLLTEYNIEKGIDSSKFNIKAISLGSWHLTDQAMKVIRDYWNADILSVYGVSEVPGLSAYVCPKCGCFHFNGTTYNEIISINEEEKFRCPSEIGTLVTTAFYPLVQYQPIIRYDTNDIFEILGMCDGKIKYAYWGRLGSVPVIFKGGQFLPLFSSIKFFEAISRNDYVEIKSDTRLKVIELKKKFGRPLYCLNHSVMSERHSLNLIVALKNFQNISAEKKEKINKDIYQSVIDFDCINSSVDLSLLNFEISLVDANDIIEPAII